MTMLVASGQWLELLDEPAALITHPGAVVAAMNMRFGAALGCEPASVIGAALPSLIGADELPNLPDDQAGPLRTTLRCPGGDGAPGAAWRCDFGPVHAGHRLLRLLPTADADALQREVTELQQKLTWFREAIDKVGHSVVIFDAQGRLVLCNKFYRDGYRSGDRVLPADIALEGKTYRELMELRVRYRLHKEFADDPDRFIEDRVRRFEDGADAITYLATGAVVRSQYRRLADGVRVYIGTDITALVEREHQQRATELAYRTKSQFLANMSHELRTPLNAIIGFSQLIRDASAGPVDARYRSYADDIHAAGQHLLALINDILDLSKIEVGRMALRDEIVDIAEVVRKCGRLVQASARERGQALEWELPPELPYRRADELRLKQIMLNLLSNAIRFTPEGGCIRITAASRPDGALVLSVADTGIGMRSEDIATALTPFQQIDRGLSRGRDGTGLGLPLAKTLAELHGATFDVASRLGVGTTVVIAMPPERTVQGEAYGGIAGCRRPNG
jgi:signal transduction histidine kinase